MSEVKMSTRKANEVIFKSYQDVINAKMKAGKDVSNLTNRLNVLTSRIKKKQFYTQVGQVFLFLAHIILNRRKNEI